MTMQSVLKRAPAINDKPQRKHYENIMDRGNVGHLMLLVNGEKAYGPCDVEELTDWIERNRRKMPEADAEYYAIRPRQLAILEQKQFYEGPPCRHCGLTTRYTTNSKCKTCEPLFNTRHSRISTHRIAQPIINRICSNHGLYVRDILAYNRDAKVTNCRNEVWVSLHKIGVTYSEISRMFGRDHKTIIAGIRTWLAKHDLIEGDDQ